MESKSCMSAVNSLVPGKFEWHFMYLIFQIISVIDDWGISCELALRWMSLDFTDDKTTLVQVMAWCHQATSHYLSQWWPRSLSPYGVSVTRPQWVNSLWPCDTISLYHRFESALAQVPSHYQFWLIINEACWHFPENVLDYHSLQSVWGSHIWKQLFLPGASELTHCGLVTPYGNINLGQHWLRYWLVAWRHQAITWTNVDLSSVRSSGIHMSAILQEMPQPSVNEISMKFSVQISQGPVS